MRVEGRGWLPGPRWAGRSCGRRGRGRRSGWSRSFCWRPVEGAVRKTEVLTSIILSEEMYLLGAVSAKYTLPVRKELARPERILSTSHWRRLQWCLEARMQGTEAGPSITTAQDSRLGKAAASSSFLGPISCCRKPPRRDNTMGGKSSSVPGGGGGGEEVTATDEDDAELGLCPGEVEGGDVDQQQGGEAAGQSAGGEVSVRGKSLGHNTRDMLKKRRGNVVQYS